MMIKKRTRLTKATSLMRPFVYLRIRMKIEMYEVLTCLGKLPTESSGCILYESAQRDASNVPVRNMATASRILRLENMNLRSWH